MTCTNQANALGFILTELVKCESTLCLHATQTLKSNVCKAHTCDSDGKTMTSPESLGNIEHFKVCTWLTKQKL